MAEKEEEKEEEATPRYWQANMPASLRPTACPPFLRDASPRNRALLCRPRELYHRLSWGEVGGLIRENKLDGFSRSPLELRRYLEFCYHTTLAYGSVMRFVLEERLRWGTDVRASGALPFENKGAAEDLDEARDGEEHERMKHLATRSDFLPSGLIMPMYIYNCPQLTNPSPAQGKRWGEKDDIKILHNDWPYGIDARIVHLVIWTKFSLDEDDDKVATTSDLAPTMSARIDEFVNKTFREKMGQENVVWFKNWASLKSIHALEHFHVMLYDSETTFVEEVTDGDYPVSKWEGDGGVR